ncbi:MAG: hypothetical protein NVSMB38_40210 [Ktedonobacteraceae bacterium]
MALPNMLRLKMIKRQMYGRAEFQMRREFSIEPRSGSQDRHVPESSKVGETLQVLSKYASQGICQWYQ